MDDDVFYLFQLGMSILSHLAVGLGLPSTAFEALFHPHPLSSLRMLHYPAPEIPPAETESSQSQDDVIYSGHTDSGCVTLLTTFGVYSTASCVGSDVNCSGLTAAFRTCWTQGRIWRAFRAFPDTRVVSDTKQMTKERKKNEWEKGKMCKEKKWKKEREKNGQK